MIVLDIAQNTPEWLAVRRTKIGASDAPIVVGVSPYKTPLELLREKLGEENTEPKTYGQTRGHLLEPEARLAYQRYTGNLVEPLVCQSSQYEWMIASLDGYDHYSKIVLEIKCPGKKDHELAKNGFVPGKYYPQLQHQLYCTGAQVLHYWSYHPKDGSALVVVYRDELYIPYLIEQEKAFLDKLLTASCPF